MDYRIKKHAEVLMRYSLNIKKGEKLLIQGEMSSIPLIKECYRQALEFGAFPQVRVTSDELREVLLKNGSIEQIQYVPDNMYKLIETIDAYLSFWSETNTRMLTNVSPEKLKIEAQGTSRFKNILFEREAKGELRWCGTLFPTRASAQEANMSLSEYEDFVYGAGYLDTDDPIARWRQFEQEQEKICKILNTKKDLRIVSRDTDLRMSVQGRRWANCCGHVNFPDGEVFTGPVEDSVEGTRQIQFPRNIRRKGNRGHPLELRKREGGKSNCGQRRRASAPASGDRCRCAARRRNRSRDKLQHSEIHPEHVI